MTWTIAYWRHPWHDDMNCRTTITCCPLMLHHPLLHRTSPEPFFLCNWFIFSLLELPKSASLSSIWSTQQSLKTLDEGFTECDTRQRELCELYIDNGFFAEYFLSGTRQRKVVVTAAGNGDGVFAECKRWHSAKSFRLCRVFARLAFDNEVASGPLCQFLCRLR
jgi:hypothetical protein